MKYRKDINGLRAYAVLLVVLYHFWPNLVSGGFVGVDVFFVISGYLMTGIILTGLQKNTFKLSAFYVARIDRIIPALAALLFVISFLGLYLLPPKELSVLSQDVLGSLFFVSNIIYSLDSGYFSTHSLDKWLLHTWSLSVEWQFYIVFPIVLLIINKRFNVLTNQLVWATVILGILIYSVYLSKFSPLTAFFYIQSRAWELLAGGLVYLISVKLSNRASKSVELIGLFLIIASALVFNKWKLWPGYLAVVPVVGTCFILIANVNQSFFTHNKFFQYIGKRSYSLYLWHWPLVVAINYWGNNNVFIQVIAFLCSFALAALSFTYIEKKLTQSKVYTEHKKSFYLVVATIFIAFFAFVNFTGITVHKNNDALTNIYNQQVMPSVNNGYCFKDFNHGEVGVEVELTSQCSLGASDVSAETLLFGDSFAGQYEPMFELFAEKNNIKIDAITTNWCHPSFENSFFRNREQHPSFKQCLLNRRYLKEQIEPYKVVILSAAWANIFRQDYFDELVTVVNFLTERGKTVYLLPSAISYDMDVLKKFRVLSFNDFPFDAGRFSKKSDEAVVNAHKKLMLLASKNEKVNFIHRSDIFEQSDQFKIDKLSVPYSLDGAHISLIGSKQLADKFINTEHARDILATLEK